MLPNIILKWKICGFIMLFTRICVIVCDIPEQSPLNGNYAAYGEGGNCEELAKQGPLEKYLQPDDIDSGKYDNYDSDNTYLCTRQCRPNEPPRICYYKFQVERYVTMGLACRNCPDNKQDCLRDQCVTADGYEKMIISVNRRMPGPSIQVCKNDLVVVDVKNRMAGTGITVHWHGITQLGTPYMDGVPMVTQCPIMEAQIFRYYFQVTNPGLYFWHSHDGLQKVDGFLGSLVVRRPVQQDPNGNRYDYDLPSHVLVIQDWLHEVADALFPGLRRRRVGQHADSYLINGKGVFMDENGEKLLNTPLATFNVKAGFSYVFRIIAATCLSCPFRFQIENHSLTIIGSDGRDTESRTVDSIVLFAGERYSVVVRGKNQGELNKQNFWIHVAGTGLCNADEVVPKQYGILRYRTTGNANNNERLQMPNSLPPLGLVMGDANARCDQSDGLCYVHLNAAEEAPIAIRKRKPDYRMIWGIDFYTFHNNIDEAFPQGKFITTFVPTGDMAYASLINGIANMMSPVPVLTQFKDVPSCLFCSSNNPFSKWMNRMHECLHVFKAVNYPSVVEIVMVDLGQTNEKNAMAHPMHLHGYDQYLIGQGVLGANKQRELGNLLRRLDNNNAIPLKPIMKDTFQLASGGYLVIRILADNPGFWIFHCHFAYHSETGMSGILQVGNPSDHPSPPRGFPTCNNFLPQL